ncbi:MAG: hypothetical protein A3J09_00760 [Candidatus Zambryskibacteria bacterium RIFCSPLOWO2_02_FULL_51_21]|uniref:Uncharacterized protein n=1 Tax=Candidatus Zambryskibacteria bacterium RIFCSPHIGHO2_02_FULL_43_37 TaxID=1802749 RepID=A0A1G2TJD1_9BACT|nr:MAG: hypothetical protein A2723_00755 [Candidatus Zambryskibacteria bacterium RIFCSPHIGHO2_01_FULL_52_18]OHA96731.1 MAG: hypothetical protein A3D49_02720 [Candidatus Zambryskibacteria bacterium RIFCSPHIGHO2_02_FULL_43_37]OHB07425.1 MAG: hypothetical protein A2944_01795 [Candidatus Zambryskibacteria bacterium RIFCSPLOWO2_01_FULL_52_12]OHB11087.1 MAG: hypothetical protein A3J09_00760 [Candidatus Zambryskibacteria bacterium RIFCSPLOWO2_02_FULL_51_21]
MPLALALLAIINLNALSANPEAQVTPAVSEAAPEMVEVVEVERTQKGMLLALVPITFNVRATADARGNVKLEYPWYSALTVDRRQEVETKARVAVQNAMKGRLVGLVVAEGEAENPYFTPSEAQAVEKVLISVLEETPLVVD